MKIYMFEHCSLCFRVRMAAALKSQHLQEVAVLDDDTETMTKLAGKRVIPILVKNDGEPMLESMDMVKYIEAQGEPLFQAPSATRSPNGPRKRSGGLHRWPCRATHCLHCQSSRPLQQSVIIRCANAKSLATLRSFLPGRAPLFPS